MTLDQMNHYFEVRGFTVNRTRDTNKGVYVFYIMKDGIGMTGEYRWPQTKDWRRRDRDQRFFLENLMREFHAKQSFNDATALYEKCLRDLTTFKEENEMNTITWKVEGYEVHSVDPSTSNPALEVNLSGTVNGYVKCTFDQLMHDIEATLNRPKVTRGSYAECVRNDIDSIRDCRYIFGITIKNVIFNNPATIVFWRDGTKTVVKAENETYDPEKGLAMAISKKVLGNEGNYYNTFRKWLPEPQPVVETKIPVGHQTDRWKIWFKRYNEAGKKVGGGLHVRDYANKGSATRAAKRVFDNRPEGDTCTYEWIVSQTNPWAVKE